MFGNCPEILIFEVPGSIPTQVNTKTWIVAKNPHVCNNTTTYLIILLTHYTITMVL